MHSDLATVRCSFSSPLFARVAGGTASSSSSSGAVCLTKRFETNCWCQRFFFLFPPIPSSIRVWRLLILFADSCCWGALAAACRLYPARQNAQYLRRYAEVHPLSSGHEGLFRFRSPAPPLPATTGRCRGSLRPNGLWPVGPVLHSFGSPEVQEAMLLFPVTRGRPEPGRHTAVT